MAASYGRETPLASLHLTAAAGSTTLDILAADERVIRVADPTESPHRVFERHFQLATRRFIPRYTIEGRNSKGWRVQIEGDDMKSVEYAFLDRPSASQFQRYVTGYGTYAFGENMQCDATVKRSMWVNEDYCGMGEIQLWCAAPEAPGSDNRASVISGGDTASITSGITNASTTASTLAPRVSHQSNGVTTYWNEVRSPLLMAFLRERGGGRTMLRLKISDLNWALAKDDDTCTEALVFSSSRGGNKGFKAYRISVTEEGMGGWDVCAMARNVRSKGIQHITVMKLSLKIEAAVRNEPTGEGTPQLSRLERLEQQLSELRNTHNGAQEPGQQIKRQLELGVNPSQNMNPITDMYAADLTHAAHASLVSQPGTISQLPSPSPAIDMDLAGDMDHGPRPPTEMASYMSRSTTPSTMYYHARLHRYSQYPVAQVPAVHVIQPAQRPTYPQAYAAYSNAANTAYYGTNTAYVPGPRQPADPTVARETDEPDSTPPGTDDEDDDGEDTPVFAGLDQRIRSALRSDPDIGSAAEGTIRTLHCLPGDLRALVYDFPGAHTTLLHVSDSDVQEPAAEHAHEHASERASLDSTSNPSSRRRRRRRRRLFRCPFNIVDPRVYRRGGCKGPGFPLPKLFEHLDTRHFAYECPRCKKDFLNRAGIERHVMQDTRCVPAPGRLPRGSVQKVLKGSKKEEEEEEEGEGERNEEERWYRMWDLLFPEYPERPEPYFNARAESGRRDLRGLEVIFSAMVDSDGGDAGTSGAVSKEKAKRYLRAAMQALQDETLDSWPAVPPDVGGGSYSDYAQP